MRLRATSSTGSRLRRCGNLWNGFYSRNSMSTVIKQEDRSQESEVRMKAAPYGEALASSSGVLSSAVTAGFDVEKIREDFPVLKQKIHGKPLVYLDNAATAQKPQAVIDAIRKFYEVDCANIHRGVHELSQRSTAAYEETRSKARRFVNARTTSELIFVRGTTEAVNLVSSSWGRKNVGAGDEIVISAMEHHSNIVPWQML